MIQRCIASALSVLFLAHLAGCSSDGVDVSTTFDPLTTFPTRASYVWDVQANRLPEEPRLQPLDLDPLIREAAEAEFAARGYRAVDSGPSDYRLSYELVVHTWIGPDNSRSVGSLSLMLVDAATERRVWIGFGRAEIHVGLTREERLARLRDAMDRMLAEFPPTQRGE